MRFRYIFLLMLASLFLAGFDSQKTDVLAKRCVERGTNEEKCRCILKLQEEMLGPKFIEAAYLQVIGNLTAYELKLLEVAAENPNLHQALAEFEARAKEECIL